MSRGSRRRKHLGALGEGADRRQVRKVLDGYVKAHNLNGHHVEHDEPIDGDMAQAILEDFKRSIGNARASDVPALAIHHLPVPANSIVVVFDEYNSLGCYDDAKVLIVVSNGGAEVRWMGARITTRKGF